MPVSSLDLTTVTQVKSYLPASNSTSDDAEIQFLITSISTLVYDATGRDSAPPSLVSNNQYTEVRRGNGSTEMWTKNIPVTQIVSVKIDGYAVAISSGYNQPGAMIGSNQDSIVIAQSAGAFTTQMGALLSPRLFTRREYPNIQLVYAAGFNGTPLDLQMAVTDFAAQEYQRRQTIDQASQGVSTAGGNLNTRFRDWWSKPLVQRVMWKYTRIASLR